MKNSFENWETYCRKILGDRYAGGIAETAQNGAKDAQAIKDTPKAKKRHTARNTTP